VIHPVHVVIATGTLGDPITPTIPGQDVFGGEIMHSSAFPGGQAFAGKRAVVVGAGNTSADICQDLVHRGATSVTMVQRSSSIVISKDSLAGFFSSKWPEDVPYEINDFRMAAMPLGQTKDILRAFQPLARDFDKEMHDGLRNAGIALNDGPDDAGIIWALFNRFGGALFLPIY
jgi:cation diffusion facilitator CzcD-associated flavoprotein CzcO